MLHVLFVSMSSSCTRHALSNVTGVCRCLGGCCCGRQGPALPESRADSEVCSRRNFGESVGACRPPPLLVDSGRHYRRDRQGMIAFAPKRVWAETFLYPPPHVPTVQSAYIHVIFSFSDSRPRFFWVHSNETLHSFCTDGHRRCTVQRWSACCWVRFRVVVPFYAFQGDL